MSEMSRQEAALAAWMGDRGLDDAPPPPPTELLRRAFHEAGHAVASRQLGMRISRLSLGDAVSMVPLMDDGERMTDSGRRRSAAVAYAGPLAETRYARLSGDECRVLWQDGSPWCGDRLNIERCELTDAQRAKARSTAAWLVVTHWKKIAALAPVLAERQTMSGDEVNEVLRNVFFF